MTDTNHGQVAVVQDVHPSAAGPSGGEGNQPKVPNSEGNAEVGTPGSGDAAAQAANDHAAAVLAAPDGYIGHNPDKASNDDYTVAGVTAADAPAAEKVPKAKANGGEQQEGA